MHPRAPWLLLVSCSACATARPTAPVVAPLAEDAGYEGDDPGWASTETAKAKPPADEPPLIAEAKRQLRAMRTTRYRHRTRVDEAAGTFEYDCSGFVAYALRNVAPAALAVLPIGPKGRPRAEDFAIGLRALADEGREDSPWIGIERARDALPGDVVAWLRPAGLDSTNTGHVAIVADAPFTIGASKTAKEIGGSAEVLLRVIDSTESPHRDDARAESKATGLGTGTIGIVVDGDGRPVGYRWRGGKSRDAHATLVAIARAR